MDDMLFITPVNTSEFDRFWDAYPRCPHRTGKPKAREAFRRARKRATCEQIMWGLLNYRFNPDPRYIPMPTTWLNQDRWEMDTEAGFDPVLRAAGLSPSDFRLA